MTLVLCVYLSPSSLRRYVSPNDGAAGASGGLRYDVVTTASKPFVVCMHSLRHHTCHAPTTAFGHGVAQRSTARARQSLCFVH